MTSDVTSTPPTAAERQRPVASRRGRLVAVVLGAAALVAVVAGVRTYVAEPQRVASASMSPTLCTGDVVLVQHLGRGTPTAGDVVTFRSPADGSRSVKRVVATAGQQVGLADGRLLVDGRLVREPFVNRGTIDGVYFGPVTVPSGSVFVLGDDREISVDSRRFGPVPLDAVDGTVRLRLHHSACPVR